MFIGWRLAREFDIYFEKLAVAVYRCEAMGLQKLLLKNIDIFRPYLFVIKGGCRNKLWSKLDFRRSELDFKTALPEWSWCGTWSAARVVYSENLMLALWTPPTHLSTRLVQKSEVEEDVGQRWKVKGERLRPRVPVPVPMSRPHTRTHTYIHTRTQTPASGPRALRDQGAGNCVSGWMTKKFEFKILKN